MQKIVLMLLSVLAISLLLAGCAEKELSQEEEKLLEAELEQMSDEELDAVIQEGESEEGKALAGQAFRIATRTTLARTTLLQRCQTELSECNKTLSSCSTCGNNVVDAGEDCDGTAQGYTDCYDAIGDCWSGPMSCSLDCKWDGSQCYNTCG